MFFFIPTSLISTRPSPSPPPRGRPSSPRPNLSSRAACTWPTATPAAGGASRCVYLLALISLSPSLGANRHPLRPSSLRTAQGRRPFRAARLRAGARRVEGAAGPGDLHRRATGLRPPHQGAAAGPEQGECRQTCNRGRCHYHHPFLSQTFLKHNNNPHSWCRVWATGSRTKSCTKQGLTRPSAAPPCATTRCVGGSVGRHSSRRDCGPSISLFTAFLPPPVHTNHLPVHRL